MAAENGNKAHSFGRYLQAIRMEKGISLEAVSDETKIRIETLLQIEEEDHAHLPDEVFVKGFLRSYARVVGADADEAVRRYSSRLGVLRKIAKSEDDLEQTARRFWPRLLLCFAALAGLIAATIFILSAMPPSPATGEHAAAVDAPASAPAAVEPAPAVVETAPAAVHPETGQVRPKPDKLLLRVETVEETWLKIIVDDQSPTEYTLAPGDRIELEAASSYSILIGNAGGVKLYLNDRLMDIPGESGQVVTVHIP
jgi:cytoskeleton protein RodZ